MNPKIITLGSLYTISENFGGKKGRKFYSPEKAAEQLNIGIGQLKILMMKQTVIPSFIQMDGNFLTDEDLKQLGFLRDQYYFQVQGGAQ